MDIATVSYALISGLLPALLWLWFWLREDNLHPEPRSLIAGTFVVGIISVVCAVILEKVASDIILDTKMKYIAWAAIEEIVKLTAVALVAFRSQYLDEPIDMMIYCITVALGFAALENALFILTPLDDGNITKTIMVGNMRFIGATLVHVVSSASIGFVLGLAFYKNALIKTLALITGIILSVTLHASFNLSIINSSGTDTLNVFGWVWCEVVILIILFEEIKGIRPKTP